MWTVFTSILRNLPKHLNEDQWCKLEDTQQTIKEHQGFILFQDYVFLLFAVSGNLRIYLANCTKYESQSSVNNQDSIKQQTDIRTVIFCYTFVYLKKKCITDSDSNWHCLIRGIKGLYCGKMYKATYPEISELFVSVVTLHSIM